MQNDCWASNNSCSEAKVNFTLRLSCMLTSSVVTMTWRDKIEPNLQFGEITYSRHGRVVLIGEGNHDAGSFKRHD